MHISRTIGNLIARSLSLEELATAVADEVRAAMQVDACSVYLENADRSGFVLVARAGSNEGPTELAGLYDAATFGWIGAQRFFAMSAGAAPQPDTAAGGAWLLGVPLRRQRRVVGAVVLRNALPRALTDAEEALLLTISVQFSSAVGRLAYTVAAGAGPSDDGQIRLEGVAGAPGIAIGTPVFPALLTDLDDIADKPADDPELEAQQLTLAVHRFLADLQAGDERLADVLPDQLRELFYVYRQIATDDQFIGRALTRVRAGQWAPAAIRDTVAELAEPLTASGDARLRARAEDVRAVGRRLLLRLSNDGDLRFPDHAVLVGSEVSLARMADVPVGKLAGIVSFEGSTLSHAALLARSLGVPAVMGIGHLARDAFKDALLIVDGYAGRVIANPTPAVLRGYRRLEREEAALADELHADEAHPAVTQDGVELAVFANVSLLSDIEPALKAGARGVGLYRTEFPFMLRDSLPSEAEQTGIYRRIIDAFEPRPVVMRTLDAGGDKPLPYLPAIDRNPLLGVRGIRVSLDHPEIFVCQIRAMLRAAAGRDHLRILLPMVSTVSEVIDARELIRQARVSLLEEGIDCADPPLGAMIEVPSLLHQLEALAPHVDFLSVGTNDLTQHLMVASRDNAGVAELHDHFQPAVLRAVRTLVETARRCGRDITICGELASDPGGVVLLIGMGVERISVGAAALARVKRVIRCLTIADAREVADRVLRQHDIREVKRELDAAVNALGLAGLIHAGR